MSSRETIVEDRPVEAPTTPGDRPRLVTGTFVLITLSTFAYFLSVGTLLPTLPHYVEGPLGGGSVAVGLAIGAFSLSAVLLRPYIGSVGDRHGRRLLIIGGAAIVAASVAAYGLADSLLPLVALRLVTGLGEAAFYVGAASGINDLAPDERRGEALSFFSLALYGGLAAGPVVGELVLESTSFDVTYLVAAAAAVLAAVVGALVPDTRPADVVESAHEGQRARFIHPAGLLPGLVLAASVWGLAGFSGFVPLYAEEVGLDASRLVFLTYSLTVLGIRLFGARLPDILGVRRAGTSALATSAAGMAVIALWASPVGLFTGAVVFGFGQALAFPALMTLAVRGAPARERGSVVGTFTAFFDAAFGLGAVSLGAVAALLGYRGLFLAAAAVALVGLVILRRYALRTAPS